MIASDLACTDGGVGGGGVQMPFFLFTVQSMEGSRLH